MDRLFEKYSNDDMIAIDSDDADEDEDEDDDEEKLGGLWCHTSTVR